MPERYVSLSDFLSSPSAEAGELVGGGWNPVNLLELDDDHDPQPTIMGVSYPGSLAVHYGEPGAVKTWLNLILCLEALRADESCCTLWIDFEMTGRRLKGRLRSLGASDSELERFVYTSPYEPLTPGSTILAGLVLTINPVLVVIDAMIGLLGLHQYSDNAREDIDAIYTGIGRPLTRGGAAVHMIDHVGKNEETRGRWTIGSERKLGGADVAIQVKMVLPFAKGKIGKAVLHCQKDRYGTYSQGQHIADLDLASDPDSLDISWKLTRVLGDEGAWRPTTLMEKVSRWLEAQPGPVSRRQVEDGVVGNRGYVRQALDFLLLEKHIEQASGPRGALLISSIRVFRKQENPTSPDLARPRPGEVTDAPLFTSPPPKGGEVIGRGGGRTEKVDLARARSEAEREIDADITIPYPEEEA